MIEEVKKILDKHTFYHSEEYGNSGIIQVMDFDADGASKEICQLFKPDRPELREKIAEQAYLWAYSESEILVSYNGIPPKIKVKFQDLADRILPLIGDIDDNL